MKTTCLSALVIVPLVTALAMGAAAQRPPLLAVSAPAEGAVNLYQVNGPQLKLKTSVPVGKSPGRMCLDPRGNTLYVTIANGAAAVDLSAGTATAVFTDAAVKSPFGCVVSPDSRKLYLADRDANVIFVFSIDSHRLVKKIGGADDVRYGIYTPDHKKLIFSCGGGFLMVIDPATDAVIRTIKTVGLDPRAMAFTPDGKYLVVAMVSSDLLSWYRADTLDLVNSFGVTRSPQGLAMASDGERLYVSGAYEGVTGVVDLREKDHEGVGEWRQSGTIPTGAAYTLAISSDGNYLYANTTDGVITVVDLRSWKILKLVQLKNSGGVLYIP